MAIDPRSLYKNADPTGEASRARRLAEQYGFPFVDLEHFQIDHGLFRDIPLDLMIRYQFIPEHRENGHIVIVVGDPTDVLKLDELELLLGAPLRVKVASPTSIRDKLQKSESTQRVLDEATDPIDKRHHSTIISRIKIMSELDIAEKRVPQDGRFKLRITGRTIDFRVSIVPTAHGEDSVIRILDKESMS